MEMNYKPRSPCPHCGEGAGGRLTRKGGQNCVYCRGCHRHLYNAPAEEAWSSPWRALCWLRGAGVSLRVADGRLLASPPALVGVAEANLIRQYRDALMGLVLAEAEGLEGWQGKAGGADDLFDRIYPKSPPTRKETERGVERWYRALARQHHPDRGGSSEAMQIVNDAYDRLKKELGL